jgi:inner membrane protein
VASIGHIAVGLAAARAYAGQRLERVYVLGFSALSLAPDFDVLAFRLGIPYEHPFGHRGASHSLCAALLGALVLGLVERLRRGASGPWRRLFVFSLVVLASHGLLDTLTDGGLGCALFWPWDSTRYFAPVNPIPVAPIGRGLVSVAALRVFAVELVLFAPLVAYALWPRKPACRR